MRKKDRGKPASAYDKALGLLARREHSARELKQKLAQRGFEKVEAGNAIGSLTEANYQDDSRFAESLIRQRAASGHGPRHIEAELRSHGIDPRSHRERIDDNDWPELARAAFRKRYGGKTLDKDERTKAAQFLLRRGFVGNVVFAIVGETDVPL